MEVVLPLFFLILAAALGGFVAKLLKLPVIVGYILSGLIFGSILPPDVSDASRLAEMGTILLLFSIGLELSYSRLSKFFNVSVIGALIQITLVTAIGYFLLNSLGFSALTSLILAAGFSLSSTAVVVKMLSDKGELDTIHGGVMFGWLLVQDLAVIPMMVILSSGEDAVPALIKALLVILGVVLVGKTLVPLIVHKIADTGSREVLLLSSVSLALGTAFVTSRFGISPALGAFLAGIIISESQEHHAIFAETRPLRDLFVSLFFVSLGFLVTPSVIFSKFWLIFVIAVSVLLIKAVVVFIVSAVFGYKGRTGIAVSFGLSQVGEFSFIIFSTSLALFKLSAEDTSIGIAVTLITLIIAPILYRGVTPFWRFLKGATGKNAFLSALFAPGIKKLFAEDKLSGHIIICGYGRVGRWVGRVLNDFGIPFVVIEYDREIAGRLKQSGVNVIYGDPAETDVLDMADVSEAKAIVLAIPDRVAQEAMIAHIQTVNPDAKIISRAHMDEDWERLKALRVGKIVQPEFEAAVAISKTILNSMGRPKEEVAAKLKSLRISHAGSPVKTP